MQRQTSPVGADFEPQTATCAACGQQIHRTPEFCPCCAASLWSHGSGFAAWACAGERGDGAHIRPEPEISPAAWDLAAYAAGVSGVTDPELITREAALQQRKLELAAAGKQ